jgi:penicillin-binding protein 1A
MAKPARKPAGQPQRGRRSRRDDDDPPPPPPRRKAAWPFVLVMLVAWCAIFGAIFYSNFLSNLPDVKNLLVNGPTRDVTILDDRGRLIARRGFSQGRQVNVSELPSYIPNAFIAIEEDQKPADADEPFRNAALDAHVLDLVVQLIKLG